MEQGVDMCWTHHAFSSVHGGGTRVSRVPPGPLCTFAPEQEAWTRSHKSQGKAQAHNRRTNLDLYLFLLLNPADLSGEGRSLDDTEYGVDEEERNDSIKLRKAGETSD